MKHEVGKGLLLVVTAAMSLPLLTLTGQEQQLVYGAKEVRSEGGLAGISQGVDASTLREPGLATTLEDAALYTPAFERPGANLRYVPGRVLVRFKDLASDSNRAATLKSVGALSAEQPQDADFEIIEISTEENPEVVAQQLSASPDVEYAQADYLVNALATPNDPLFSQQWNMTALDMERAWDINPGASSSIVVAVVDSGAAFRTQTLTYTTVPIGSRTARSSSCA